MKIQFRYRTMVLAALAISLLAIAGFPQTAWAGNASNARAEQAAERRESAPGQERKAGDDTDTAPQPAANNEDDDAGPTTHGSDNGPGGQTCDGDPDNADGAGGVYENTCDSYPNPNNQGSDNGAGDGAATGKPCEGCVGNADDKNPPGQAGGGPNDHNNGYECDQRGRSDKEGNNGVGFGNPAHTGCEAQPEPPCEPAAGEDENCQPICVPTQSQNPDCSEKCKPTSTQNADCTEKCRPTSTQNADCTEKCVPTATQDSSCKEKTCPAGQQMGTDGTCSKPCVAGQDAECSQVTPSCVESATKSCGGGASVLGEVLARPAERLDVLGVSIEAPAAVAPAALARTGGFQLTALVQAGMILAGFGLALTVMGRRRSRTVDVTRRIAGQ